MKKILMFAIVAAMFASCDTHRGEVESLQNKVDSLEQLNKLKDSNMSLIVETMSGLQENLNYIKQKENIITTNLSEGDNSQIQNDVDAIYNVLLDNKKKVKDLEAQLRKATSNNKELNQLISVLQKQIDAQNEEIEKLSALLKEKDVDINALTGAVISLTSSVDSLATEKAKVDKSLENATSEINTCYYIIGTRSYLRSKNVIEKDGIFKKKILASDVDTKLFTAIDKTQTSKIDLGGNHAKVLSQHNEKSYELVDNEDGKTQSLVIKDAETFWKTSRYLVVRIRE